MRAGSVESAAAEHKSTARSCTDRAVLFYSLSVQALKRAFYARWARLAEVALRAYCAFCAFCTLYALR